jgi:hypothetical protein
MGLAAPLLLALGFVVGCDKPAADPAHKKACEDFSAHLATVIQKEQGEEVPKDQVEKMTAATVEKCLGSEYKADEMKCAMAASTTKDIAACDKAAADAAAKSEGEKKD